MLIISAPILQFLCLLDLCARNESETFLKCPGILYRPPCSCVQFLNFVNKIFVISRLITKFTKILCHENLELYGTGSIETKGTQLYEMFKKCYLQIFHKVKYLQRGLNKYREHVL